MDYLDPARVALALWLMGLAALTAGALALAAMIGELVDAATDEVRRWRGL